MPIYEFVCTDCGQSFEQLVFTSSKVAESGVSPDRSSRVTCPTCQSQNVTKKVSTFASRLSGGGSIAFGRPSSSSCSTGSV